MQTYIPPFVERVEPLSESAVKVIYKDNGDGGGIGYVTQQDGQRILRNLMNDTGQLATNDFLRSGEEEMDRLVASLELSDIPKVLPMDDPTRWCGQGE